MPGRSLSAVVSGRPLQQARDQLQPFGSRAVGLVRRIISQGAEPALDARVLAAARLLLRTSHLTGPDDLPPLVVAAGAELGAESAVVYLVDYDQRLLVPLREQPALALGEEVAGSLAVDSTLAGRSYVDVAQHASGATTLWSPVVDGTERLGVLQLKFPAGTSLSQPLRDAARDLAALVAELVTTKSLYGDLIERTRRQVPMTVPAEILWRQLPPLTFVSSRVAIAGVVAPTAEVAGDCFDYALNGDILHVALFDAMGHGLEAALLASVALATLRNARRGGLDLADTIRAIDEELRSQFGPDRFVTGIVGELDIRTGWWHWLTCGHHPALLVRDGQVVKELDQVVAAPLGLELLDHDPTIGAERLQPGDALLLYTDGVIEARDATGSFFGTSRLVELATRQAAGGRPVAEMLRRLNHAILDHQDGVLQDDATTLMVEWLSDQADESTP